MLFLLWGASGSGKSTVLTVLKERLSSMRMHDFDEEGVPVNADKVWRQERAELWVERALEYQAQDTDMLLAGQLPIGELLACPSASSLTRITSCLLDCSDQERVARLRSRNDFKATATQEMLCWASWMRMHASDPQWYPTVITDSGFESMQWDRWVGWKQGDPRWRNHILDSTTQTTEETGTEVTGWITTSRLLDV